jgi:hypothetical protein
VGSGCRQRKCWRRTWSGVWKMGPASPWTMKEGKLSWFDGRWTLLGRAPQRSPASSVRRPRDQGDGSQVVQRQRGKRGPEMLASGEEWLATNGRSTVIRPQHASESAGPSFGYLDRHSHRLCSRSSLSALRLVSVSTPRPNRPPIWIGSSRYSRRVRPMVSRNPRVRLQRTLRHLAVSIRPGQLPRGS